MGNLRNFKRKVLQNGNRSVVTVCWQVVAPAPLLGARGEGDEAGPASVGPCSGFSCALGGAATAV